MTRCSSTGVYSDPVQLYSGNWDPVQWYSGNWDPDGGHGSTPGSAPSLTTHYPGTLPPPTTRYTTPTLPDTTPRTRSHAVLMSIFRKLVPNGCLLFTVSAHNRQHETCPNLVSPKSGYFRISLLPRVGIFDEFIGYFTRKTSKNPELGFISRNHPNPGIRGHWPKHGF